jgi:hypothetical protein
MAEEREVYTFWEESQKEGDHLEDKGIDGRMGSEWILGRLVRGVSVVLVRLAQEMAGDGLL